MASLIVERTSYARITAMSLCTMCVFVVVFVREIVCTTERWNDMFVLIPSCALPRRLHVDGSHLSVQVILNRRNQEWLNNIREVWSYLYPIHNSKSFLVTPSLASSLYLMLMYFITGEYPEVYKMVESCVSKDLSPEEVSYVTVYGLPDWLNTRSSSSHYSTAKSL